MRFDVGALARPRGKLTGLEVARLAGTHDPVSRVVAGSYHAVFAVRLILVAVRVQQIEGDAVREEDDAAAAGVLPIHVPLARRHRPLIAALNPQRRRVAVQVLGQVYRMAAVVEQAGSIGHHQVLESPQLAARDDLPHLPEAGVIAALRAQVEDDTVAPAGSSHGVRLGQGGGHAFLAVDGLHSVLGRVDHDVGVMLDVGGDTHHVEVFSGDHLLVVGVLPLLMHRVLRPERFHEITTEIRARHQVRPVARQKTAPVRIGRHEAGGPGDFVVDESAHSPATDDGRPVGRHGRLAGPTGSAVSSGITVVSE